MGSLKLTTASSGSVILSPANTASDVTITVPAVTGTMATIGPAFSAYSSVATSVSNATWTKIAFQTEEYDTASAYDATTNYRFQPQVAGYYQVNGQTTFGVTSNTLWAVSAIYKNGTAYKYGINSLGTGNGLLVSAASLVYFNGSTDYVEFYSYQNSGSTQSSGTANANAAFQAVMVRAA